MQEIGLGYALFVNNFDLFYNSNSREWSRASKHSLVLCHKPYRLLVICFTDGGASNKDYGQTFVVEWSWVSLGVLRFKT